MKSISPKSHCLIDYGLGLSLLVLPSAFGLSKKVKRIYAAEALTLLPYVAVTESPVAFKPLIPFKVHGKIDPFNLALFASHHLLKAFRKDKKASIFNIAFTAISVATVLLTNWKAEPDPEEEVSESF